MMINSNIFTKTALRKKKKRKKKGKKEEKKEGKELKRKENKKKRRERKRKRKEEKKKGKEKKRRRKGKSFAFINFQSVVSPSSTHLNIISCANHAIVFQKKKKNVD